MQGLGTHTALQGGETDQINTFVKIIFVQKCYKESYITILRKILKIVLYYLQLFRWRIMMVN